MRPSSSLVPLRRSPSRPRRSLFALLCATALLSGLLLLATVASGATSMRAGTPGTWSLLGSGIRTVSGQIGIARTADGVLHVIWSRGGAGTPYGLFETSVTPAGKVSGGQTIVSGWARIDDVDATVTKGEPLTIGFTGTKTDTTGDATNGLTLATKNGSWTVGAAAVYSTDLVGSSVPAIGYSGTGESIQAWSAGGKITVHVGTDPAKPARSFGEVGGNVVLTQQVAIGTKPNPANDSTGIGWCGDAGIFWGVAAVSPDPKIGFRGQVLPGSSTTRCPAAARTNLILGHAGGFYAAASVAAERKVLVWHIGDQPMTAAAGPGIKQQITLGSDPSHGSGSLGATQTATSCPTPLEQKREPLGCCRVDGAAALTGQPRPAHSRRPGRQGRGDRAHHQGISRLALPHPDVAGAQCRVSAN